MVVEPAKLPSRRRVALQTQVSTDTVTAIPLSFPFELSSLEALECVKQDVCTHGPYLLAATYSTRSSHVDEWGW